MQGLSRLDRLAYRAQQYSFLLNATVIQETARVLTRTPRAEIASDVLGPYLKDRTRQGIMRAESATQGLTLALLSPEFQRR